jgi:hypothetical protein
MQDNPIGFVLVVLKAGAAQSGMDLSWEGQAELELSVGPLIRGRFVNMDIGILNPNQAASRHYRRTYLRELLLTVLLL